MWNNMRGREEKRKYNALSLNNSIIEKVSI
jgi:hypothetical protein